MKQPSVAIVGFGAVGQGIRQLFPDAVAYDPPQSIGSRAAVNACEFAMIAVPTPARPDGSADVSIVEEAVGWIECEHIVLRSTVPVGTTDRLRRETGKSIVFQPEYGPAATPDHPFNDLRKIRWVILGGERADTIPVADLYKTVFNSEIHIHQTDARTAELTKYMENCFLALKVTFCNEFYDAGGRPGRRLQRAARALAARSAGGTQPHVRLPFGSRFWRGVSAEGCPGPGQGRP